MDTLTLTERKELQMGLEARAVEDGIAAYRQALAEEGTGSTTAGNALLKAAMGPMVEAVKAWLEDCRAGVPRRSASLFYMVDQTSPEAVAFITAKAAISHIEAAGNAQTVARALAWSLEAHVDTDGIARKEPSLAAKLARVAARTPDAKRLCLIVRKASGKADVTTVEWDDGQRLRLGILLLEMFAQSTGLIALETGPMMRGKTSMLVRPTEACRKWLEESHARCELLQPVRLPMVCPPRYWTSPFDGGYLTKALRQPLVKTRNKGYLSELREWEMPVVYAAVNALQETAWAVNTEVMGVVKALWEASSELGGLPSREHLPRPARSWSEGEEPSPEVLHAWKVDAAKTHETNAKTDSKRRSLVQKLYVAERMIEEGANRFWFVYNLDWRGRIYPVAPGLSPQGDDIAKGMLRFAHGSPLGDEGAYWLAVHGANTFGVDKVSFQDRINWVQENEDMILACAGDPYLFREWAQADSPFCFLAFCFEWAKLHAFQGPVEEFISYLPVQFDGTCNGLQNFSAMLRDEVGGKVTGLIPGHKPTDIYTAVAQVTGSIIDREAQRGNEVAQRWVGKMTRKLAKRNTMTVPYGVTLRGMRDQLFLELSGLSEGSTRAEDAAFLAGANYEAIGQVVVAARVAMDWLKEVAKLAASMGLPVSWVTPSGFLVCQDYREAVGDILDFEVVGRRFKLVLQKDGEKLATRKQALGISPNFVHSLDAAHLMRTVALCKQDGIQAFSMIHDSYGTHAGQCALLRDNLRQAFVDQYREPVLEQFREEVVRQLTEQGHLDLAGQVPPVPRMGSLDLEGVLSSEYFFA